VKIRNIILVVVVCRVCYTTVRMRQSCGQTIVWWNGCGVLTCQSMLQTSEAVVFMALWWYSLCFCLSHIRKYTHIALRQ